MGAVSHSTPPGRVEVLPDPAQTNGHPLPEERVGIVELLQADCYQVPLQAGFLQHKPSLLLGMAASPLIPTHSFPSEGVRKTREK